MTMTMVMISVDFFVVRGVKTQSLHQLTTLRQQAVVVCSFFPEPRQP